MSRVQTGFWEMLTRIECEILLRTVENKKAGDTSIAP